MNHGNIEQKAQPFLGRTRYSLSVLQDHLRSMIFMSYERPYLSPLMRYDQFSVEKRTFSTTHRSTPNLKMFPLHCIYQILSAKSPDTGLIIRAKRFSSKTYTEYIRYLRTIDDTMLNCRTTLL